MFEMEVAGMTEVATIQDPKVGTINSPLIDEASVKLWNITSTKTMSGIRLLQL